MSETKLKIAVHRASDDWPGTYAERWIEALKEHSVDVLAFDFRETDVIERVRGCDGAMWFWRHTPDDKQSAPKILAAIELGLRIPVFPNLPTAWHFDEKVAQHYLLEAIGAPKVRSWVFWNYDDAIDFAEKCSYPIVFKLSVGAGAANVLKLDSFKGAKATVRKMFRKKGVTPYTFNEHRARMFTTDFKELLRVKSRLVMSIKHAFCKSCEPPEHYFLIQKNYAYFQEFMPDNSYDIRVTVIGNRAFGLTRSNRPGDFRASGSGVIDFSPENIPSEAVRIAHDISLKNAFRSMSYDFLHAPGGELLISEVSYCAPNWSVHNFPGYWDRDLVWHEGAIWPEYAEVEDFLEEILSKRGSSD